MDPGDWWIIKIIFGGISGIFALLAAIFAFLEIAQNDKHETTRIWFKERWIAINESYWLSLPEKIIKSIFHSEKFIKRIIDNLGDKEWFYAIIFLGFPIPLGVACFLAWGIYAGVISFVLPIPIALFMTNITFNRLGEGWGIFSGILIISGSSIMATLSLTWLLLNINIIYASVTIVVLFPVYGLYLAVLPGILINMYTSYDSKKLFPFSLAIAVSFTVTFLSMLFGHFAKPSAWIPQTLQMLISNVIFDGITMVVTLMLLAWAIAKRTMLRIPCAISIDIITAAFLACCSLFFGLVFTDKALTFCEISNILFGKSLDGKNYELGPYFWTMHTTFLPTLLYLLLILVGWTGKLILVPIRWFFGIGHEHKNPLKLTAAVFTIFAIVFGSLSFAANAAQEHS